MINITKPQIDDALIRVEPGLNQYLALQAAFGKLDVSKSREFQRK
jgi:hypothetical protein